ncbi:MAG: twin transmembrane helix small protein [Alphaproteobacteria bacterium]|nr:twin transmembrane helix small protein [Alphaproteobacteria bacterium]
MTVILVILLIFSMLSVLAVLGLGLFSMAKGGDFSLKYGNKLMQLRIVLQAVAILVFIILLFLLKQYS